jgi:hypothetical protein
MKNFAIIAVAVGALALSAPAFAEGLGGCAFGYTQTQSVKIQDGVHSVKSTAPTKEAKAEAKKALQASTDKKS